MNDYLNVKKGLTNQRNPHMIITNKTKTVEKE